MMFEQLDRFFTGDDFRESLLVPIDEHTDYILTMYLESATQDRINDIEKEARYIVDSDFSDIDSGEYDYETEVAQEIEREAEREKIRHLNRSIQNQLHSLDELIDLDEDQRDRLFEYISDVDWLCTEYIEHDKVLLVALCKIIAPMCA